MDEFDDFDIGPQADEFAPFEEDLVWDDGDEDTIVDEDEVIFDDDDLRPYSKEWNDEDDLWEDE